MQISSSPTRTRFSLLEHARPVFRIRGSFKRPDLSLRPASQLRPPVRTANRPFAALLTAGFILVATLSCTAPQSRAKNVVLISIDTLRADHLGSYGHAAARTPVLDGLAARGARFERATSVMPLTLPSHSSLMTGTFPTFHGVRDNGGFYLSDEAETLAEVLAVQGYATAGFVAAFVLDSRWGISQGFGHYFDDFDLAEQRDAKGMDAIQRPGRDVVDQAINWLDRRAESVDSKSPFFTWLHLYDPHTPYTAPDDLARQFPATREGAYDAEIAETDRQIGRLFEHLKSLGELDDTLVVVVADHGEMLGEHDEVTHGFFIYEAATHIPMIFSGPGVDPTVVPDQVRIIDVMPTVLDLLGKSPSSAVQGASLLPLLRGEPLTLDAYSESWYRATTTDGMNSALCRTVATNSSRRRNANSTISASILRKRTISQRPSATWPMRWSDASTT